MFKHLKKYSITDTLFLVILLTLPLAEHWNSKALLLFLIYAGYQLSKEFNIIFPKIGWLYISIFSFSALSILWTSDISKTSEAILRLLPLLLFTLTFGIFLKIKSHLNILRITAIFYLFYLFILLIIGAYHSIETNSTHHFFYHELTAPLAASAVYIALLFAILYFFILNNILFSESKKRKLDIFLAVSLFGAQFLLSSKMILSVSLIITVIFFSIYLREKLAFGKKIMVIIGLAISLIVLISISSFSIKRFKDISNYKKVSEAFSLDYFGPDYYFNGLTLRLFQIRCFIEIEQESSFNSFLGTGFNASQSDLNRKYTSYDLYRGNTAKEEPAGYFLYNFHNQYIQTLIELGIFGFLILVLLVYYFLIFPIRTKNLLLFGITFLFIAFAITESFLFRQKGIVSFILFTLFAISMTKSPESRA